jgi:hypothetical protein
MVRKATYRDVPALDADNALDDADVDSFLVKDRTLLDMQFDVARNVARRTAILVEAVRMTAQMSDAVT